MHICFVWVEEGGDNLTTFVCKMHKISLAKSTSYQLGKWVNGQIRSKSTEDIDNQLGNEIWTKLKKLFCQQNWYGFNSVGSHKILTGVCIAFHLQCPFKILNSESNYSFYYLYL